jgi:hypothetical protein
MIDVHRCKAALVVMCVPERKLLGAMGRTERIVDVEDLKPARLHGGAELVNESCTQPRRLGLAWRILKARDGRLRGQRFAALRTAPNRKLHQGIMPQPVEVDGIFIAAGDRRDTRHHHFEYRVSDAVRIAAIRHRVRKPPAHTERALRFSQQQQATIGGLVAAIKINCEFLAADRWKVKGKQRIVTHGGCGARLIHGAICFDNDLLRESRPWRYSRRRILRPDE